MAKVQTASKVRATGSRSTPRTGPRRPPPELDQISSKSVFERISLQLRRDPTIGALGTKHAIGIATNLLLVVDQISGKCKYPIESFDKLLEGFGGANAAIVSEGAQRPMAHSRASVPDGSFPILSEDDLIKKIIRYYHQQAIAMKKGKGERDA
jgi:hypothetical protein